MSINSYKVGWVLISMLLIAPVYAADVEAGKSKAQMCVGCHGQAGVSRNATWPNLAGQQAAYIEAQLGKFKSKQRQNPIMNGIAFGLEESDMKNLAAYFAGLPAKSAGGDADLAQSGKAKAGMCMGCHGNELAGRGGVPRLAGQHPKYLIKQLHDFKNADRKAGHMNAIAKNLSDADIEELANFLGSL